MEGVRSGKTSDQWIPSKEHGASRIGPREREVISDQWESAKGIAHGAKRREKEK